MNLKYFYRFLFLLTVILLYSCSGVSENNQDYPQIPIREIKNKLNKNSSIIETLEASGTISIDSPELSNSASFDIKLKKPDTVFVKIEGPFGINVASALITRKDFIYYNAQENKAIIGPTNDLNIGAILRIKISFDELLNSFSGSFIMDDNLNDSSNAPVENNAYVITEPNQLYKRKYYIEPATFTLSRYNLLDNADKSILDVNYSNYNKEVSNNVTINFPTKIKIYKAEKDQTVWLEYGSKEINKHTLTFKIKVPKSAKVIKWE